MNSSQEIVLELEKELEFCCGTTCDKCKVGTLVTDLKRTLIEETPKQETNNDRSNITQNTVLR